jgi:hypothetical protein
MSLRPCSVKPWVAAGARVEKFSLRRNAVEIAAEIERFLACNLQSAPRERPVNFAGRANTEDAARTGPERPLGEAIEHPPKQFAGLEG